MKKPSGKSDQPKPKKPSPKSSSQLITESVMRSIQKVMEGKQFASLEEANAFLASLTGPGLQQSLIDEAPLTPQEQAQDLAFDAMEAETAARARKLANRALALDPDCVDALVLLTNLDATSPKAVIAGLQKAVAAGERALGASFFAENKGHFWGIVETRPYMRARLELAQMMRAAGLELDAMAHLEAVLELNPNDNQGVRYVLLGSYLANDRLDAAQKLLNDYEGDDMASFAWGKVLERFLAGDLSGAESALERARAGNPFVELYLTARRKLPTSMPEGYQLGSDEEAIICLDCLGAAWPNHPAAATWLMEQLFPAKPVKRRARKPN